MKLRRFIATDAFAAKLDSGTALTISTGCNLADNDTMGKALGGVFVGVKGLAERNFAITDVNTILTAIAKAGSLSEAIDIATSKRGDILGESETGGYGMGLYKAVRGIKVDWKTIVSPRKSFDDHGCPNSLAYSPVPVVPMQ